MNWESWACETEGPPDIPGPWLSCGVSGGGSWGSGLEWDQMLLSQVSTPPSFLPFLCLGPTPPSRLVSLRPGEVCPVHQLGSRGASELSALCRSASLSLGCGPPLDLVSNIFLALGQARFSVYYLWQLSHSSSKMDLLGQGRSNLTRIIWPLQGKCADIWCKGLSEGILARHRGQCLG